MLDQQIIQYMYGYGNHSGDRASMEPIFSILGVYSQNGKNCTLSRHIAAHLLALGFAAAVG